MTGQDLRKWRKAKGLTQEQLATMLGHRRRSVIGWEADETPISLPVRCALQCIDLRDSLAEQLTKLQTGQMMTGEKRQIDGFCKDVDTTAETMRRLEAQIANIDAAMRRTGTG